MNAAKAINKITEKATSSALEAMAPALEAKAAAVGAIALERVESLIDIGYVHARATLAAAFVRFDGDTGEWKFGVEKFEKAWDLLVNTAENADENPQN